MLGGKNHSFTGSAGFRLSMCAWTSRFIGRDCHKTAASASGPSIRLTGDSDSDSDDPDTLRSPDRLRSRATPGPVQSRLESLAVKV